MAHPPVAPTFFVPVWFNRPTSKKLRSDLGIMAILMACVGGVVALFVVGVGGAQPWVGWALLAFFSGPVAWWTHRRSIGFERAALAAVAAIGEERLEQRTLAIVAALSPSWSESSDLKEPLQVSIHWESRPQGMVATLVEVHDSAGAQKHRTDTGMDALYGLRLVPWQAGQHAHDLGMLDDEFTGPEPRSLLYRVHLPPLTAHNRLSLMAAAAPGLDAYAADMAPHRPHGADDAGENIPLGPVQ